MGEGGRSSGRRCQWGYMGMCGTLGLAGSLHRKELCVCVWYAVWNVCCWWVDDFTMDLPDQFLPPHPLSAQRRTDPR